ncbi:MAG: hypothetical protein J5883_02925 [Clostridiales bacterium]|nr:hypothetical protein [Clostridiales bacterium]
MKNMMNKAMYKNVNGYKMTNLQKAAVLEADFSERMDVTGDKKAITERCDEIISRGGLVYAYRNTKTKLIEALFMVEDNNCSEFHIKEDLRDEDFETMCENICYLMAKETTEEDSRPVFLGREIPELIKDVNLVGILGGVAAGIPLGIMLAVSSGSLFGLAIGLMFTLNIGLCFGTCYTWNTSEALSALV